MRYARLFSSHGIRGLWHVVQQRRSMPRAYCAAHTLWVCLRRRHGGQGSTAGLLRELPTVLDVYDGGASRGACAEADTSLHSPSPHG